MTSATRVTPQELAERAEIMDVLVRYTRGVDRLDMEVVRSCYHPDAIDDHGLYCGDIDGLIAYISVTLPTFERTMHFLGNHTVEIRGDEARTETYAVAYHRHVSGRTGVVRDNVQGIRYLDRLTRRDGQWRIAERKLLLDWIRIDEVPTPGAPPETWERGRRGSDDASAAWFAWPSS